MDQAKHVGEWTGNRRVGLAPRLLLSPATPRSVANLASRHYFPTHGRRALIGPPARPVQALRLAVYKTSRRYRASAEATGPHTHGACCPRTGRKILRHVGYHLCTKKHRKLIFGNGRAAARIHAGEPGPPGLTAETERRYIPTLMATHRVNGEQELLSLVDTQEAMALVERFSTLVRESGTRDEFTAADYIVERLN